MTNAASRTEVAVLAAGCFWGVEETFRILPGVISTEVGYTGGHTEFPTYETVCSDQTGHAEALRILFDPAVITYDKILGIFFDNHDPTTVHQQGPDVGSQYRSAMFFTSPAQEKIAHAVKDRLQKSGRFTRPIVTEIAAASTFYPAESYHQKYLQKRGFGSCHIRT